jgi:hypothetical protein
VVSESAHGATKWSTTNVVSECICFVTDPVIIDPAAHIRPYFTDDTCRLHADVNGTARFSLTITNRSSLFLVLPPISVCIQIAQHILDYVCGRTLMTIGGESLSTTRTCGWRRASVCKYTVDTVGHFNYSVTPRRTDAAMSPGTSVCPSKTAYMRHRRLAVNWCRRPPAFTQSVHVGEWMPVHNYGRLADVGITSLTQTHAHLALRCEHFRHVLVLNAATGTEWAIQAQFAHEYDTVRCSLLWRA